MAISNRCVAMATLALLCLLAVSASANAAVLVVNNTTDSNPGSLRAQIAAASAGDVIEFSVTGTITLTSGALNVDKNLTVMGPTTPPGITISGAGMTGGLIEVSTGVSLTLENLTMADAFDTGDGGAIFHDGATLDIERCTFKDNVVARLDVTSLGGAIFLASGTATINNSTFVGNTVAVSHNGIPGEGGAIYNDGATLAVTNSTFSGNDAAMGAAISSTGGTQTSLRGTIFANSTGGGQNCGGTTTDAGHNISDDGSCASGATSVKNSTMLNLDPAGLQNNGGPTKTIALEPDSQAVNFIPVANCTDQSSPAPQPLKADQRGFPRPDFGNPNFCDAGAFELQTMPFALNSEKMQIARPTTASNQDQLNLAITFTEFGSPICDAGNDAFNGISGELFEGTCASIPSILAALSLGPFVTHTVGGETYGTFFETLNQSFGTEIISARMVQLATPDDACGQWTLHLELSGLDTVALGLGGGNPFGLILQNPDGDQQCFDITDAVVGNQLPTRKVRRGTRR